MPMTQVYVDQLMPGKMGSGWPDDQYQSDNRDR